MINIFFRINEELASWVTIWRFLRGLDRDKPSSYPDLDSAADSSKNGRISKANRPHPSVMRGGLDKQNTLEFRFKTPH